MRLVYATAWFCAFLFMAVVYPAAMVHAWELSLAKAMAVFAWFTFTAGVAFSDMMTELHALDEEMEVQAVDAEELKWRKLLEHKPSEYGAGRLR